MSEVDPSIRVGCAALSTTNTEPTSCPTYSHRHAVDCKPLTLDPRPAVSHQLIFLGRFDLRRIKGFVDLIFKGTFPCVGHGKYPPFEPCPVDPERYGVDISWWGLSTETAPSPPRNKSRVFIPATMVLWREFPI